MKHFQHHVHYCALSLMKRLYYSWMCFYLFVSFFRARFTYKPALVSDKYSALNKHLGDERMSK